MLFYNKVDKECVTENVTFAQRPEGIEKLSHVDIWGDCNPGSETEKKSLTRAALPANC